MAEKSTASRRRARSAAMLGVGVVGAVTASIGIIPSPAYAVDYPSWSDVQKAKHDVAHQKKMITRINGLISDLQNDADAATTASMRADNDYQGALLKLSEATRRASDLKKQAAQAEKKAETSRMRAGLLASHLARTGAGGNLSIELFLRGGDKKSADDLLYQLGTMSKLTEQSRSIYTQAVADHNTAQSLTDQAKQAQKAREHLADEAKQALEKAKAAQAAAEAAVATQKKKSDELVSQLATLKNTSVATEKSYQKGVAVRKAAEARRRAEEAAKRKAAEERAEAARRAAAKQHASSGSSSGSSSGGSRPASSGHSSVPNGTAVERAIAYAKAQLGEPYVLDGAGPNVWDCSGLTMKAYEYAGIYIGAHWVPSQYDTMAARGDLYPYSQRRRGDLLFWSDGYGGPYHVAIYLGNNMMIAAPKTGDVVKIQPVWGYGGDLMMTVGRPAA